MSSWDEFVAEAEKLLRDADLRQSKGSWDKPHFRGHADSSWKLQTTIERQGVADISCSQYDRDMRVAATAIKTVSGVDLQFTDWVEPKYGWYPIVNANSMSWLRQNGFPSPLLDWSLSPYVASFFAYCDASLAVSEYVAIYSFIETVTGSRSGSRPAGAPTIVSVGPWIGTDKKHFLQQSNYTYSVYESESDRYHFSSHENALLYEVKNGEQMIMKKYLLPASERDSVLSRLRKMNITKYSLFETTEALLQTIADDVY